jgi:tRNA (guanosine-2'-O-)-methyltransferase
VHAITEKKSIQLSQMSAGGVRKWIQLHCHKTTEACVQQLKAQGMQIVTTCLADDSKNFRDIDYTKPTAILVGTELEGISQQAMELADEHITIPMFGHVQSLNVSVATALVLYEAQRQRELAGMYDQRRLGEEDYKRLLFEGCHPQVTRYCKAKKIPYPAINDEAEIIEPLADSKTFSNEGLTEWLRKKADLP